MERYSISFTLGKASAAHGANVNHNNRKFLADNINPAETPHNISYKIQSVESAYEELFGEAIREYNEKQKHPCRRIADYYSHIANGHREEPFYEAVVQFGDCKSVQPGTQRWYYVQTMLNEYMLNYQQRNPNLFVFNAVMHLDEASPHLHIDFIPFYTQERQRGLKKGVSMRAALIEQGFVPQGKYLAAKHWNGERYIRFKSLGEEYSGAALRGLLDEKLAFEKKLAAKTEEAKAKQSPNVMVLLTARGYMDSFITYRLPIRKLRQNRPLTWVNDAELDRILSLNAAFNRGETLDFMHRRFHELTEQEKAAEREIDYCEHKVPRDTEALEQLRKHHAEIHEELKTVSEAQAMLEKEYPDGQNWNWREFEQRLENAKSYRQQTTDHIEHAEADLREAVDLLDTAEQVLGGTFLQNMAQQEMQLRQSANDSAATGSVSDGQTDSDAPQEPPRYVPRRR